MASKKPAKRRTASKTTPKVRRPKLYAKLKRKGMPEAVARKAANKPSRGAKKK